MSAVPLFDEALDILYDAMCSTIRSEQTPCENLYDYLIRRHERDALILNKIHENGYFSQHLIREYRSTSDSQVIKQYIQQYCRLLSASSAKSEVKQLRLEFGANDFYYDVQSIQGQFEYSHCGVDKAPTRANDRVGSDKNLVEAGVPPELENKCLQLLQFLDALCQPVPLAQTKLLSRLHSAAGMLDEQVQMLVDSGAYSAAGRVRSAGAILRSTMRDCISGNESSGSRGAVAHLQYIKELHCEAQATASELVLCGSRDILSSPSLLDRLTSLGDLLSCALNNRDDYLCIAQLETDDDVDLTKVLLHHIAIARHPVDDKHVLDLITTMQNERVLQAVLLEWFRETRIDMAIVTLDWKTGYSVRDLLAAGYSATELRAAGYSALDLRSFCGSSELRRVGYSASELRAAGLSAICLANAGFSTRDIRCAGCSVAELLGKLWEGGRRGEGSANHCHRWTFRRLRDAGYEDRDIHAAGCHDLVIPSIMLPQYGAVFVDDDEARRTVRVMRAEGHSAREVLDKMSGRWGRSTALFELRSADFSAKELRDAGFSIHDLAAARYGAEEVMQAGFSISQMRTAGYSASALIAARCSYTNLFAAGFSYAELSSVETLNSPNTTDGQHSRNSIQRPHADILALDISDCSVISGETSFTCDASLVAMKGRLDDIELSCGDSCELADFDALLQFQDAKKRSICEMREAGLTSREVVEMLRNCWGRSVTLFELRDAGFTASDLRKSGCGAGDLLAAGYIACDLLYAGYCSTELRDAGCGPRIVWEGGFSLSALRIAGYSAQDMLRDQFSLRFLQQMGYERRQLMHCGISPSELRACGFTCGELLQAGYGYKDLRAAGYVLTNPIDRLN